MRATGSTSTSIAGSRIDGGAFVHVLGLGRRIRVDRGHRARGGCDRLRRFGASAPAAPGTGYQQLSYTFTATETSHPFKLTYLAAADAGSGVQWDDVSLTQDQWVQTTPATSVTEQTLRSQSGRIVQNTLTDVRLRRRFRSTSSTPQGA